MFSECSRVEAQARATGAVNTCRPLTKTRPIGRYSRMAKPLLRGREHARKRALAANISPNQTDVKQEQAEELGPLHILLSQPPQPKAKSRGVFLKTPAKRLVMAAYCRGLLSVGTTQKIINKFNLGSA